jgi:hypothetical protein
MPVWTFEDRAGESLSAFSAMIERKAQASEASADA